MTTPHDLAARIERADGPDRALFCEAFKLVFPEVSAGAWDAIDAWDNAYDRFCALLDAGGSIDAAMQLVPEGCAWRLDFLPSRHEQKQIGSAVIFSPPASGQPHYGGAPTPAQALCAAALRARGQS